MTHIKQELRRRISETLTIAQLLPPGEACDEIRDRLLRMQDYCSSNGKTFIFIEQRINCHQFELGGRNDATATLFRGPSEDASVAICVTDEGSLLYRNDSSWTLYRNEGDVVSSAPTLVQAR
ncbi:hypothetical protein PN498_18780 [Oscillatoria sp. CS-180]|uniref:hypothetical protein n=1 Tax=Oscillatoria sp. CS-180 TaxID=3021720 RepID=UPI00232FE4D6|nr:hypothetical protein [Oscillatoria sp. CS-180]MDB9528047.1 hypothetical protein [Oscillatoria sp. CS-180]